MKVIVGYAVQRARMAGMLKVASAMEVGEAMARWSPVSWGRFSVIESACDMRVC